MWLVGLNLFRRRPIDNDVRRLEVPQGSGPWSWRRFHSREEADAFHSRLGPDHPRPIHLAEAHLAPDETVLTAGTWIVVYRPIIV
jgi:hypothetical protein